MKAFFLLLLLLLTTLVPPAALSADYKDMPDSQEIGTQNPAVFLPLIITQHPTETVFGVETNSIQPDEQLEMLVEAGTSWIRRNGIKWSDVEPQPGQIDWSAIESMGSEVSIAKEEGTEVIVIVRNTPEWAQKYPGSVCGPIREDAYDDFGEFMFQVVSRLSAPPYNVKYWEIGNEPDAGIVYGTDELPYGCWGDITKPYFGGEDFVEMLKVVYPRIKAADPESQVLLGGLLLDCDPINPPEFPPGSGQLKDCTSSRFLEGILANNGAGSFDGVSFHSYDNYYGSIGLYGNLSWHSNNETGPVVRAKARFIKDTLAAYGADDKYIMNTETALLCSDNCDENFELTKAYFLVQNYALSMVEGVKSNIWFDLHGRWRESGLIFSDGEPRPAMYTYRQARSMIGGAQFTEDVSQDSIMGYEFRHFNRRVWVLWSTDLQTHTFTLPGVPAAIEDSFGAEVPVNNSIKIGIQPVFVVWAPSF